MAFTSGDLGHVTEHNRVVGLDLTADGTNVQPLIAAAFTAGDRVVQLPPGTFTASASITIPEGCTLRGVGAPNIEGGYDPVTTIQVTHSGHGVILAGIASRVESVGIQCTTTGTAQDGIAIQGGHCGIENVTVRGAGRDGVSNPGVTANHLHAVNTRSKYCGRHGFFLDGSDGNRCTLDHCDAVGNTGHGFWISSASNVILNSHSSANTAGGICVDAQSNLFLSPYIEGGTGGSVTFTANESYTVWINHLYASVLPPSANSTSILIHRGHILGGVVRPESVVLSAPDGGEWAISVSNAGTLSTSVYSAPFAKPT